MLKNGEYVDEHVCFIFGIDDALLGAGVGLFGGVLNNLFAGGRQEQQQSFNAEQAARAQIFNAQQAAEQRDWASREAGIARQFTGDWAERSMVYNADQQNLAREFNAAEAQKGRDWTEEMSSTAYQRTMADMKAAGLNPILAYRQGATGNPGAAIASGGAASSGGASASAPSGASASGHGASTSQAQVFDILQPALQSAMQVAKLKSELNLIDAQTVKTLEGAKTEGAIRTELGSRSGEQESRKKTIDIERDISERKASQARNEKVFHDSAVGKVMDTIGAGSQSLSKVLAPVTDLARGAKNVWGAGGALNDRWYGR